MAKMLKFPKEKSKRVTALQKAETKRLFASLSIISFILVAVFVSDFITRENRPVYVISDNNRNLQNLNRAIASAQPMNMFRDVEWEHQLAKKLGQMEERKPASIGQGANLTDQLRYGELAGKYRLIEKSLDQGGRVKEIEYVDSLEAGDRPIYLRDREGFLSEYRKAFAVPFEKTQLDQSNKKEESYRLLDTQGRVIGKASFQFDEEGHFVSLKVAEIQE